MIKKEITKKNNFRMSLALLALAISMVLGCPASSNGAPDTIAPTLVDSNPSADSTSFSADADITLTYSEAVQAGTGNITITPSGGNAITIAVTDTAQVSIAGAVVTLDLTNNLTMSTTYVLTIPAGAFMDAAGNNTAEDTVDFSTAATLDRTAPTLSSSVPAADATDFPANSNIRLTYSEPVQAGTGNITITPSGGDAITIAVGDAQVTIAGAVVTINPSNNLAVSTTYTLTVPAGAIVDASGNAGSLVTLSFTTAAVIDETAPTVSSSVPAADATDFNASSNIILTYDEPVQAGTGNITITPSGGAAIMIPVGDAQVSIVGAVVTINPTNNLAVSTTYTLTIPADAFIDASGNKTAEITLSFSTVAVIVPVVISSVPATDGAINVADNIVLTFSEPVLKGSGNIGLASTISGGRPVSIDVTDDTQVRVVNNVVTIDPPVNLGPPSEKNLDFPYALTIDAGAFMDASGNKTVQYVLEFKTLENLAPSISSSLPVSDATNFSANSDIILTYSEAVVKGSGSITLTPSGGGVVLMIDVSDAQVSLSADGTVVTINPSTNLALGTSYELALPRGTFMDVNRNPSSAETLSFMTSATLDTTGPMLVSSLPASDALDFSADSKIVLAYDEFIFKGSGDITITPMGGGTPLTIAVSAPQVSVAGAAVTIDPSTNLAMTTSYTLAIPAGAFRDVNGNTSPAEAVSFSTAATLDTTRPMLVSSLPANGATGFSADGIIVLTFDELVQAGTNNIRVNFRKGSSNFTATIPASDSQVSFMGNMVIIDIAKVIVLDASTGNLVLGASYTLTLFDGAFLDASGNTSGDFIVSFSTAATLDTTAPMLSSSVPANDATGVLVVADIVLTYNEPVAKGSGNVTLTPMGGGTPLTIPVSSPSVSISADNTVVTIDPTDTLEINTTYTLTIPAGAFTDASGNSEPELTRSFTTAVALDTTPPSISSSVPAEGGVIRRSDNGRIVLTFSEVVVKGTGTIILSVSNNFRTLELDLDDVATDPLVTISGGGTVVTIDISGAPYPFDSFSGRPYALTVPATAFADLSGNNLARDYTLNFSDL